MRLRHSFRIRREGGRWRIHGSRWCPSVNVTVSIEVREDVGIFFPDRTQKVGFRASINWETLMRLQSMGWMGVAWCAWLLPMHALLAQVSGERLSGEVVDLADGKITVRTASGQPLTVALADNARITIRAPADLTRLDQGLYVGASFCRMPGARRPSSCHRTRRWCSRKSAIAAHWCAVRTWSCMRRGNPTARWSRNASALVRAEACRFPRSSGS